MLMSYIPMLSIHLHLAIVRQSKLLERFGHLINVIIIIVAVVLSAIAWGLGLIKSSITMHCSIPPPLSGPWIMYPRTPFIIGGILLHFWTTGYILWAGVMFQERRSDWIRNQIRVQWRSLMIALVTLVLVGIFMTWYYSVESKTTINVNINTGICSPIALANWPDDRVNTAVFTGLFTCGLWVVLIIGTQSQFYIDFLEAQFPVFYIKYLGPPEEREPQRNKQKKKGFKFTSSSTIGKSSTEITDSSIRVSSDGTAVAESTSGGAGAEATPLSPGSVWRNWFQKTFTSSFNRSRSVSVLSISDTIVVSQTDAGTIEQQRQAEEATPSNESPVPAFFAPIYIPERDEIVVVNRS
ncbi:hypothetical protein HK102_004507 [Quaeritorhiza haematococci]|nr:hypothetical protein HK102_004507 [Quaeritorhiza haematococci]